MRAILALLITSACRFEPPPPRLEDERLFTGAAPSGNLQDQTVASFDPAVDYFPEKTRMRHAMKLRVEYHNHYKLVTVLLEGMGQQQRVLMVQRGTPRPAGYPDAEVVWVPVRRWSSASFHYGGVATRLGVLDGLISLGGSYTQATLPEIVARIADGRIRQHLSDEQAALLEPEVFLSWAPYISHMRDFDQLHALGLTPLLMVERLEESPLGRAEWIKYFAMLFNKEREAERLSAHVETEYGRLADLARAVTSRSRVLVDLPGGQGWTSFGGRNASARLIADAGGAFVLAGNESVSSQWQEPLERAYDRALDADLWLLTESVVARPNLVGLIATNPYTRQLPVRANQAVYIGHGGRPGGPNPYWDRGLLETHLVLADHIRMLHPDLVPDHAFAFYQPLASWLARGRER